MKAIEVSAFGDPGVLRVIEREPPQPGPGEVLLRVEAVGLNWSDLLQRSGDYVGGPRPPFVAGQEAAATVVAQGPGVTTPRIGAPVIALARAGLAAELAVVPAIACLELAAGRSPRLAVIEPDRKSTERGTPVGPGERPSSPPGPSPAAVERAALPIALATAYHALVTAAHATAGETVLVHAAGGGLGTIAVQLAKCLGLRVVATCSRPKHDRVAALGADVVCDYDDFTAARDADLAIDSVGGDVFRRTCDLVRARGRVVVVGCSSGDPQRVDPQKLVHRSLSIIGVHLRSYDPRGAFDACLGWLAEGRIRAQVDRTLPLVELARAHELLASRGTFGKIVLTI